MARRQALASPCRRSPTWLVVAFAAVVVAGGCSDDDDGDSDGDAGAPPVATVRGTEIFSSDVEALASDAGFLSFIGAPASAEGEGDVSQTEAGRRTLTWLIYRALVDAELAVQGLEVGDAALEQAADELGAGEVPDEVDVIVDGGAEAMGDDAFDAAAEGLAAYETLDEWLRTIDPADAELQDRIRTEHPEVTDRICGSAVAVDETDAATVREQLTGGASLDQIAALVEPLLSTSPGGECLTRGSFRRELIDLWYGTPIGSAGEKTVVSRSTGQPVVFFVVPTLRDEVTGADADAAVTTTLQRLHDEGAAAFSALGYSTVDPNLDAGWGTWDPTIGVVAADAAPAASAFDLPDPATTTTVPAPPATTESQLMGGVDPIIGPSDPGTGDLLARAQAALEGAIRADWRQAVPVQLSIIDGGSSLSYHDGRLQVGTVHATGDWVYLGAVMGHEFGHHAAFRYGTQAELGAPPAGWPSSGERPVERWADCVSITFTGYPVASHGQDACSGPSLTWASDWLAPDPVTYPRTG